MDKKQKFVIYLLIIVVFLISISLLIIQYRNKILSQNKILVYFSNYDETQQKSYLVSVIREITPVVGVEEKIREAIKQLFNGPTEVEKEKGFTSAMPEKATLLNVYIQNDIVYLDFSKEIEAGGGSLLMMERLAQIVLTSTQFPSVKSVRIQVEGRLIEYFSGEGITDVALPMNRDNFKEFFR